ncbi:MAG: beta-lactamase family protein [Propionibacteriaceae bacterium]|jgi:CubicO group peptidase (beta-lactamase class C family)|nr:beta-lactamase family protein [Propionibacteriaceae bacterium]
MTWERVRRLAGERGGAWSLVVDHAGETVFDERHGVGEHSLFYTFSVTKPVTALAVHLLAERGQLDLDQPIAAVWPGYARHGKAAITPRHVLTHSAGVPYSSRWPAVDAAALLSWRWSVWLAAHARPRSAPGAELQYHVLSFGFILGELVRRVDGRRIEDFAADEFFRPLGLVDSYLSLPRGRAADAVPLVNHSADPWLVRGLNYRIGRRACSPASSLQCTARDLAGFYRVLLNGGVAADGRAVIPAGVIAAARARYKPEFLRYGTGFQLGGMGGRSNPDTFGHNGSNVCAVWADPERDLVCAYLSDYYDPSEASFLHLGLLSDAVLELYS